MIFLNILQAHISEFLTHISVKGYSKHTLNAYQRHYKRFLDFADQNEIKRLEDLNHDFVIKFLGHLQDIGLDNSSRNQGLASLKSFFRFLSRLEIIPYPLTLIQSTKSWERVPVVLSQEEVKLILNQCNSHNNLRNDVRNKAFLELLYGSGLRISEALGVLVKDIQGDFVKVFGKGQKERIVPVSQYFCKALEKYWETCRKSNDLKDGDYVFMSKHGKPLDRFYMWRMIQRKAALAKITKQISPHTFRHSFAVHLLNNGADIRVIQELLGHSSISSTGIYLNLDLKDVVSSFKKFHPRFSQENSAPISALLENSIKEDQLESVRKIARERNCISSTLLQRKLKITYRHAKELCMMLEKEKLLLSGSTRE